MARRLPSLNGLKAFEAAARSESFSDAAMELAVTHAAISRHIRELEEYLGTELFYRTGRGVELTDAGRLFGTTLTPLFDQIANASREAAAVGTARSLKVSVQPNLASHWLVSRLGQFNELHPDIELMVDSSNDLVDFYSDDIDLGLRYGYGNWTDVDVVKLTECVVFPVCAPSYLAKHKGVTPQDLPSLPLIHEDKKQWWVDWLSFAGVETHDALRGPILQSQLAIEAAQNGQGFVLVDQILFTRSLQESWLVKPFTQEMKDHGGYYLARKKGIRETGPMRAFREWVASEMADTNKKYQAYRQQALKQS
ncbi:transcriptional regulator GcvA [Aestuariivirga litoralis]|uniref:transcriptional regulator GcvA n=1 Tax=Aestuariivirga litoralis TaxID=2650924 RepID=UPI0018C660CF|nr:transcriptional regulator GcvA [Aestuariivirga litoralis]MBG1231654.1 transcriptional regulator GcvA [Aestuariivirga litoralis]